MTKSPRKNVPDVGIELGAACMPSELASDRTTGLKAFFTLNKYLYNFTALTPSHKLELFDKLVSPIGLKWLVVMKINILNKFII